MKLAIYGDSFAETRVNDARKNFYWGNILAQNLNVDVYDNFAVGGTSLDFSYMKFLESHEKYDIIIFVATASYRSSVIQEYPAYVFKYHFSFFGNQDLKFNQNLNQYIDKRVERNDKINLKVLKNKIFNYQTYPHSYEITYYAMLDSIIHRRPDTILIDAFPNIRNPHWKNKENYMQQATSPCMYNIQLYDYYYNGYIDDEEFAELINKEKTEEPKTVPLFSRPKFKKVSDYWEEIEKKYKKTANEKYCHLSKAQNEKFAEYVYKHINEDDFNLYNTLDLENVNKFYPFSIIEKDAFIYE